MQITDLEKQWIDSQFGQSTAMKALLEADKLNSQAPSISDAIGDQVRLLQEEEEARYKKLMLDTLPKSAAELCPDRFGSLDTLAKAAKSEDEEYRQRLFGAVGNLAAQLSDRFGGIGRVAETLRLHDDQWMKQITGSTSEVAGDIAERFSKIGAITESLRIQNDVFKRQVFDHTAFERVKELAMAAQHYPLDDYLDKFKTPVGPLTDKMLYLNSLEHIGSPEKLKAFVHASTVSDILGSGLGYDYQARQAFESLTRQAVPPFDILKEYGQMLSAAGLSLPHWPHPRLLTIGEHRQQLHRRAKAKSEPKYAKRAWSVFQRHEVVLREVINELMTKYYGDDWPHEQLPRCGCKGLLGKGKDSGDDVLDHADFTHYIQIMCHDEHFALIFSDGFDDPGALRELLESAKKLRRPIMHFREFTMENLRDVRGTWKSIEAGLLRLMRVHSFECH